MHPYAEYEGGPIWVLLEEALTGLETNGDVTLHTERALVVGYLCQEMRQLYGSHFSRTDVRVWQKLCAANWPTQATDWERLGVATGIVHVARAGTAEHVTEHLLGPLAGSIVQQRTDPVPATLLRWICAVVDAETPDDEARAF